MEAPINQFDLLKEDLIKNNKLSTFEIENLTNSDIPYKMSFYNIKASEILNDIEAKLFNLNNIPNLNPNNNNNQKNSSQFYDLLKQSIDYLTEKNQKNKKNKKINKPNIAENPLLNNLSDKTPQKNFTNSYSNLEREGDSKNLNFQSNTQTQNLSKSKSAVSPYGTISELSSSKKESIYKENIQIDENKNPTGKISLESIHKFNQELNYNSINRNPNNISLTFYPDNDIPEYKIIPSNDNQYAIEYVNFFRKKKLELIDSLKISGYDLTTMYKDKFIFVIFFNDMDKPNFKNIYFCDPENNFKEFYIREEDKNKFEKYFISNGQIVLVEGEISGNIIGIKDIKYGFDIQLYEYEKEYVMNYYRTVIKIFFFPYFFLIFFFLIFFLLFFP
jgi:hypothetical protein